MGDKKLPVINGGGRPLGGRVLEAASPDERDDPRDAEETEGERRAVMYR